MGSILGYILGIPFAYAERSFVARGVQCQSRQLIGLSQIAEESKSDENKRTDSAESTQVGELRRAVSVH